jgi:hypothetical protein
MKNPDVSTIGAPGHKAFPAASDQALPAAPTEESKDSTAADHKETLPPSVAHAIERLNKAAQRLQNNLPEDISKGANFKVEGSRDINSLADNIGSALVKMMEQRQVEESKQSHARSVVVEWAKKTIPFVKVFLHTRFSDIFLSAGAGKSYLLFGRLS